MDHLKPQAYPGYNPVDCGLYDHLELACLYGYTLNIVLKDGTRIAGRASTLKNLDDVGEFLVIELDDKLEPVRLDLLRSIEPVNQNARFGLVEFS